ncbi:MAG: hypothetical protein Q8896_00280 [Bacteroidota bacterium]|nr:hypothetical protein [Bacteroidota bacterium]MDP4234971.1 hypothetical protein [Bacteroidota bacterium]
MKHRFIVCLIIFIFASTGCVSTKVSSLKDPTYYGHHLNHILVFGNFQKIEYQQKAEWAVVNELRHSGILADPSYQVLPPLRQYTDSEKVSIFRAHHFDCYAIIEGAGSQVWEVHVPTYTSASANATVYGNSANAYGSSTTTGGYTTNTLSGLNLDISLFDFNNGHKIFYAQAESSSSSNRNAYGIQWVGAESFLTSASENLADEMMKNDLFQSTTK